MAVVSELYSDACALIQQAACDMYEDLHDEKGNPINDAEYVASMLVEYRKWLLIEIDLIRETAKEFSTDACLPS